MTYSRFDDQVAAAWAHHFGSSPADLEQPGSTLLPRQSLAGSGAIYITHIRAHAFVELDPSLNQEFGQTLIELGQRRSLSTTLAADVVPKQRLISLDRGLVYHLESSRLVDHQPDGRIERRPLGESDKEALSAMLDACQPGEVDDAFVAVDHEIAAACLEGGRILSAGSGYRRNGFMDLGVITHPAHRGRHLAPAVVSTLSHEAGRLGIIAQYRCDVTNTASRRVAEHCGYTLCFATETVLIAPQ